MVDPLSYFYFQPVLHDWQKNAVVCVILSMGLCIIGKSSLCGDSMYAMCVCVSVCVCVCVCVCSVYRWGMCEHLYVYIYIYICIY